MDESSPPAAEPVTAGPPEVVTRFYDAFAAADGPGLAALLHPRFTARVSAGMPLGVGGSVSTPGQMLRGVWGKVFAAFEIAPVPDEFVIAAPERVIVFGFYRGRARSGGRPVEAAFAHDVRLRDGLIESLAQITDTALWREALAGGRRDDQAACQPVLRACNRGLAGRGARLRDRGNGHFITGNHRRNISFILLRHESYASRTGNAKSPGRSRQMLHIAGETRLFWTVALGMGFAVVIERGTPAVPALHAAARGPALVAGTPPARQHGKDLKCPSPCTTRSAARRPSPRSSMTSTSGS